MSGKIKHSTLGSVFRVIYVLFRGLNLYAAEGTGPALRVMRKALSLLLSENKVSYICSSVLVGV